MLHIISQVPIEAAIIGRIDSGGTIILIEDAVLSTLRLGEMAEQWLGLLEYHRVCVLEADLDARGVSKGEIVDGLEVVDYRGFVELTVENAVIHSWC